MTPFEAIYGRPPPKLKQPLLGETKTKIEAVVQELTARDELQRQLSYNLTRA